MEVGSIWKLVVFYGGCRFNAFRTDLPPLNKASMQVLVALSTIGRPYYQVSVLA